MTKKKKFILLLILMIAGRCFDAITTYNYIPDLTNETNILVVWFGSGWTFLLVTQVVLITLITYCLYYHIFKFTSIIPEDKTLTFKQYISYFHFNDPNSFAKLFYKRSKNKRALFALIGYVVPMILISISYVVGLSTTLLIISEKYKALYKKGGAVFFYCLMGILAIFFFVKFFRNEYGKYKTAVTS